MRRALLALWCLTGCGPIEGRGVPPTGGPFVYQDLGSFPDNDLSGQDGSCVQVQSEAKLVKSPVDIIFVIDNSGSMSDEIQAVQDNINKNFAQIIAASNIDYHIIM